MATVVGERRVTRAFSVVLMARLVDRVGKLVGPDSFDAIEYSVFQFDESGNGDHFSELICDGEPLRVNGVMLRQLQHERHWDAVAYGFNFRHYFLIPSCAGRWTNGSRFEVRYVFTQMTGEETAVRFRIRATRND